MKKIILFLLLIPQAAAVNVSVIVEDNVTVEGDIVIHRVHAYTDVENVTVVDYHPTGVILHGIPLEEETFMDNKWNATRLKIGNLSANQVATVSYQILEGMGEALLGANNYYLEGEKHQLYPKSITINVKKEPPVSTERFLFFPFMVILLLMVLMYLRQKRKERAMY